MEQIDTIVEMLSEKRAGSKLKCISITHSKRIAEVSFVFENDGNADKVILVWGKDLGVGFGSREIIKGE